MTLAEQFEELRQAAHDLGIQIALSFPIIRLVEEAAFAKKIIRRGWDDHMWNFETMDERDENWLRRWAGMDVEPEPHWGYPPDAP